MSKHLSNAEVSILRCAPSTRIAAIALNRSYRSVRNKWSKLGLGKVSDETRFWSHVGKGAETGGQCWLWLGCTVGMGRWRYGQFSLGGKSVMAHVFSWEMAHGVKVPVGMKVLHRCDVPACVRPNQLFLGTPKDNAEDRERKGRGRWAGRAR